MTSGTGGRHDTPGRRPRRLARPVRPFVPLAGCAAVLLTWELVAHNSGAGWVQAVGDLLGGVLAVGLLAPALAVGRARLAVDSAPADATAGLPAELTVRVPGRLRATPLEPAGPPSFVGPGRAGVSRDRLTLVPTRRGVHEAVVLELASAAPFGIMWWRRQVVVTLPRPLHVAPRVGTPLGVPTGAERGPGSGTHPHPAHIGEPRGVRPYRPGDPRRVMHWPATAHSGDLMVREMEEARRAPVTLDVHLPHDDEAAEALAERALATVLALIDRGAPVVLATTEADGGHSAAVTDRHQAGRRLARAVAERRERGTVSVAGVGVNGVSTIGIGIGRGDGVGAEGNEP